LHHADLNGDGVLDMMGAKHDLGGDRAGLYYAEGVPGMVAWPLGMVDSLPAHAQFLDVNNDSTTDVVFANPLRNAAFVLVGGPDFPFRGHAALSPNEPTILLFPDLNGDGLADLITAGKSPILLFANDGAGRFAQTGSLDGFSAPIRDVETGDWNGDGVADLAICAGDLLSILIAEPL
jgi:hypothetical protein